MNLVVLSLILASGCITAPVGFYESAFPYNTPFYGGIAGEWGRNYEGIPRDTRQFSYAETREIVILQWFSYSPVPKLSLGPEISNAVNGFSGNLRAKVSLLNNDRVAVAAACRGGGGYGSWGGRALFSDYEKVTRYHIYNFSATGILSYSLLGGWRKGSGPLAMRASLNAGPKILITHLDYTQIENFYCEDTVYSDTCQFLGRINDLGWFLGANAEVGIFTLGLEVSFLSVESPLMHERAWTRFWGISVGGTF